jgi:hypothetical protein
MGKSDESNANLSRKRPPARTIEARENQMVSLAVDLAEKQLREGKASSQVITHYLKLGSPNARIEREILEKQKDLITAKTDQIKSQKQTETLYRNALKAMRSYSGQPEEGDDYD